MIKSNIKIIKMCSPSDQLNILSSVFLNLVIENEDNPALYDVPHDSVDIGHDRQQKQRRLGEPLL